MSRAAVAADIIVARYRAAVNGLRSFFAGSPHISFRNSFICLFCGFKWRPRPRFYARVKRALRICKAQTLALPLRKGVKYNRRRAPRGEECISDHTLHNKNPCGQIVPRGFLRPPGLKFPAGRGIIGHEKGRGPPRPKKFKGENAMLQKGSKAPDFTLNDGEGNSVSLSDFAGKKVVLYFYPKDNTPGCTRQACAFASAYEEFARKNAVVVGVSRDSVASHKKFAEKYGLPFILLSDPELRAIGAYGVWQEKKLYGKTSMGVVRTTFIIDEEGVVAEVMPKVRPDTNAAEVLALL